MSHVYRRPPQAQFRQKRKLTPTLFADPPASTPWPGTPGGDLLLSLMDAASEHEVFHVESVTTGETTWTHDGTPRGIVVLGMHLDFEQTVIEDSVAGVNRSTRLPQIEDDIYSNP